MKIGGFEPANNVFMAPMAGVTNSPFRVICHEFGCGLTYTEMASAKGIAFGGERTKRLINIAAEEAPAGVQLFGSDPAIIADTAARLCGEFSGQIALIDLNMGCPAKKIVSNGEGSALMRNAPLAAKIIAAVVRAIPVPVTVKMRAGWDEGGKNAAEFAKMAQDCGAAAVCVHGRTAVQQYSGKADWGIIAEVKNTVSIPVIGNGDIFSAQDALDMFKTTGCDAVMVARGALGNPWIFAEILAMLNGRELPTPPSASQRIAMALRHADMLAEDRGERSAVLEMRKHAAWYLKGLPNTSAVKSEINTCTSLGALREALMEYLRKLESE